MGSRTQQTKDGQTTGNGSARAGSHDHYHTTATEPIAEVTVAPQAQQKISLGNFTPSSPPTGFAVQPGTETDQAGSVITELLSLGNTSHYELVLRIANNGTKTEQVKIWQM